MGKEKPPDAALSDLLALKVNERVGAALAEKLEATVTGISPRMTRGEVIAAVITEKAMAGDLPSAKYIAEAAKEADEKIAEPFAVQFRVVGNDL